MRPAIAVVLLARLPLGPLVPLRVPVNPRLCAEDAVRAVGGEPGASGLSVGDSASRHKAVAAEREEAERLLAASFASLKEAGAGVSDGALDELKAAQARLADLRCEEQRRQCEADLNCCVSGAEAAELLDALVGCGVGPDAQCYLEALWACVGGRVVSDGIDGAPIDATVWAVRSVDSPDFGDSAEWAELSSYSRRRSRAVA